MWQIECAGVGGLDGLFIGHVDVDAIGSWLTPVKAWTVDGKEVASAGCVSECSECGKGWGTVTIVDNWSATRIKNRASASTGGCNCPDQSVGGGAQFLFFSKMPMVLVRVAQRWWPSAGKQQELMS